MCLTDCRRCLERMTLRAHVLGSFWVSHVVLDAWLNACWHLPSSVRWAASSVLCRSGNWGVSCTCFILAPLLRKFTTRQRNSYYGSGEWTIQQDLNLKSPQPLIIMSLLTKRRLFASVLSLCTQIPSCPQMLGIAELFMEALRKIPKVKSTIPFKRVLCKIPKVKKKLTKMVTIFIGYF